MKLYNNQQAFFALVRAGLWADAESTESWNHRVTKTVDWDKVYQLAAEQSVQGLVLQGLEWYKGHKPGGVLSLSQDLLLQWIGEAQMIEQQNLAMNEFVAELIEKLRKNEISAILVKGQGIAQCYDRPLWRVSGDIDLLLDETNYFKARAYCNLISDSYSLSTAKNKARLHQEYQFGDWTVELHGTMHADLSRRMDREIDHVQNDTFTKKQVRVWKNGETDAALPSPDNDLIFIFSHILQHLFFEGIGIRQICDWCRLLWTYRSELNLKLLEKRLGAMGIMSEWKVLAAFAVKYLGMPADAMPLYSEGAKWKRKADRVCSFIMEVGNFGHNREVEWSNPFKRRLMLIWHRFSDTVRLSFVFPIDAPKYLMNYAFDGVRGVIKG